jgi:hypothetical protein
MRELRTSYFCKSKGGGRYIFYDRRSLIFLINIKNTIDEKQSFPKGMPIFPRKQEITRTIDFYIFWKTTPTKKKNTSSQEM